MEKIVGLWMFENIVLAFGQLSGSYVIRLYWYGYNKKSQHFETRRVLQFWTEKISRYI